MTERRKSTTRRIAAFLAAGIVALVCGSALGAAVAVTLAALH